jgi:hypothetical protein
VEGARGNVGVAYRENEDDKSRDPHPRDAGPILDRVLRGIVSPATRDKHEGDVGDAEHDGRHRANRRALPRAVWVCLGHQADGMGCLDIESVDLAGEGVDLALDGLVVRLLSAETVDHGEGSLRDVL